ncbi:DHH family phosphoesterase [Candidatus Bathyarchaeota archaeon]|nr:DHH family phosphoesterase [Candidatus Bathyarchaeota archaeon]
MRLIERSRNAAILVHQNADPDALCSGYALDFLLRELNKKIKVHLVAPEGVSKVTKRVLNHVRMKIRQPQDLGAYDLIFTVDTNTFHQLGKSGESLKHFRGAIVVVDHHNPDPHTLRTSTYAFSNEKATSTAQIIYGFYKELGLPMKRSVALALFLGIAYDTRHFALATSEVFKIVVDLLQRGIDAQKAMKILQAPMTESERIARLKASQRLRITKVGEWILVSTYVGSHQASVARGLLMLGADVAVVAGEKKGQTRVSLRCTQAFHDQTGVHLGRDIARQAGELIHGAGGGHALASGICGQGEVESVLDECMTVMTEKLKGK